MGKRATRAPICFRRVVTLARMEGEEGSNTGSPGEMRHTSTGTPRGEGRAYRVAERPVVLEKRGNARGGKGPQVRSGDRRGKGLGSGESLKPRKKKRTGDPGSITCKSEGAVGGGRRRQGINRPGGNPEAEVDGVGESANPVGVVHECDRGPVCETHDPTGEPRCGKTARPVRRAGTGNVIGEPD